MRKFRPANTFDHLVIGDLLAESEISASDLNTYLEDCWLAFDGTEPVGVIGVEIHEDAAVLRSLVVREEHRKAGLGTQLVNKAIEHCRNRGVEHVFVVVSEDKFGKKVGFETAEKSAVPKKLSSSSIFENATAKVMKREIPKVESKAEEKSDAKAETKADTKQESKHEAKSQEKAEAKK